MSHLGESAILLVKFLEDKSDPGVRRRIIQLQTEL